MATDTSDVPPAVVPRTRVRRRPPRPDHNRPLEILGVLLLYIIVVHYALKFAAFFLPEAEEAPTRDEMLRIRGAAGVLGFSPPNAPLILSRKTRLLLNQEQQQGRLSPQSHNRSSKSCSITTCHSLSTALQKEGSIQINTPEKSTNNAELKDSGGITRKNNDDSQPNNNKSIKHKRPRIPVLSYQDNYVIVSKPSGMTMHHNSNTRWGRSKSPVLQTTIHKQLSRKPYLVHRLDHRTSGAVIMGFDSQTAGELHGRLRGEDATKLYVALVRGDLREKFQCAAAAESLSGEDMSVNGDGSVIGSRGSVSDLRVGGEGRSGRSEHSGKITVNLPIKVDEIDKEAQTDFYFLSSMDMQDSSGSVDGIDGVDDPTNQTASNNSSNNSKNGTESPYLSKSLTLLLCLPHTGRIHQIRRHVRKALNSPVIGDSQHGDSRVNRFWRETVGLDRLGLHCWYLELPPPSVSPEGGDDDDGIAKCIECMAPLTADFSEALQHEILRPLWEEAILVEPRLTMDPYDERGGTFGRYYRKRTRSSERDP